MNHRHDLNCEDIFIDLNNYIDGELEQTVCQEIEAHIESCPNCRIVLDTLRQTIHICKVDGQEIHVPEDVRQRLLKRLELDRNVSHD